jgi:hypothetical protein
MRLNVFRIRTKFRITVCFFLTDTCIGVLKSSGVRKFRPNSNYPDKSSAGLTRVDCNWLKTHYISIINYITNNLKQKQIKRDKQNVDVSCNNNEFIKHNEVT